jgi:hypothetical protein
MKLFEPNVYNICSTIEFYILLLKQLDQGGIPNNFDQYQLLQIKQHMVLDIIMKVEIMIESILVLADALSVSYHKVPRNLTHYDSMLLYSIMIKIQKDQYNMRKILGLPNIKTLDLTKEERLLYDFLA